MKKIYLVLFIALSAFANAQTALEIKNEDNGNAIVLNGAVFSRSIAPFATVTNHFLVKNVSASTKTIAVRRFDNTLNTIGMGDKASAYFCVGTFCYAPQLSFTVEVVAAGATFSLQPKLDEASASGESNITYEVFDNGNPTDLISMEFRYNTPVSVKENNGYFSSVSSVYPNPANAKAFVDVNANTELNAISIKVYNSLGSVVNDKKVNLSKGKNTVAIDTENLNSGIYFVSIGNDNSRIVKKITINN